MILYSRRIILSVTGILQSSFVIKPVKEIDVEIPVGIGVGGGVGVQMEEGVDEEDEAPEDNSQLTLAQLRTSFKTSILQYIQPVQWGLCLETGTRLVSSTPYVSITHLCRDDLVNLFTDIFKLSKSKYLLFGNEGFLENKVGEQLNNTGVVQAAFKGAIARYKTWTTTGLKFGKSFHEQFSHSNCRYLSVDGHTIFPRLPDSQVRGMQSAVFDQNKQTALHIEGYFLDSCDEPARDIPWPPNFPSVNLHYLNLMRLALEKGGPLCQRLVVHPLGFKIFASARNVIHLCLTKSSTINFLTSKNKFVTYRPGAISITYDRETGVFKSMLPLQTHHMYTRELLLIMKQYSYNDAPRRYPTTTPPVNRNSIDVSFNQVQELLSNSFKEMAETRKYYAANPSNPKAREEYRHASHLVQYLRNRIQKECSAKHRRKLEDAMIVYARQHNFGLFRYNSVKLGAVHAEDTELFKSRMGSFHSPDVWITNPTKAVQSAFRNAFGTSRLLLSSDPGGRTVETQMASTGHVVQIGVGFEAVICRLQKRISKLQSFRDRAID
ncbi:hypothetical protein BCR33DRAFT_269919 [Rhizoclosmatium globosum]|uniref:Uncharacterized protein n=1 Tax=Rhizoclosmatium globosum TaxID=329046 RepID=A0A1Y2C7P3_9FUNG|nr:hypothetical protein BCR33DRAFT_269919 [Rhizoclosmatium globosum]|eukprot:ORY43050.1 hypothetical protein BCR33DRAFT_269919 [Rhizoclosmatium globosum]